MGTIFSVAGASEHLSGILFAVNLSAVMAVHAKRRVAFVDPGNDYYEPEKLMPEGTEIKYLEELVPLADKLNESMLAGYFSVKEGKFTAMLSRNGNEGMTGSLSPALALLARHFDYVIVHSPSPMAASFADVTALGGQCIILTGTDIFSLNRARSIFRHIRHMHCSYAKLKTVITEPSVDHTPVPDEILHSSLEGELLAVLPVNQGHLSSASNKRMPAAFLFPDSPFTHVLKDISVRLAEEPTAMPVDGEAGDHQSESSAISVLETVDYIHIKEKLHRQLIDACREHSIDPLNARGDEEVRNKAREILQDLVAHITDNLSPNERQTIVSEVLDEAFGLGCIEYLLQDPEVTEIMVNGPEHIFVEKNGKISPVDRRFTSPIQLRTVIDRIVSPIGRRVDESSPIVDARLPDGSRVNVIIPPVSLSGMVVTIRKFSRHKLTVEDLIERGSLSRDMASFLSLCVSMRKNIVIAGGTGSGKTTLLNVLSGFIPEGERIVTIEDAAEIKLSQPHVVSLESRPPSIEGTNAIPIRRLVINALRMRPDRIVVGECRGGETLDMLQAMNTGHDGSLTTVHANSPRDSITRITTLSMMAGTELPERSIREQIAAAIHIIVQVSRLSDGSRKIVEIAEIDNTAPKEPGLTSLFRFEQTGILGSTVLGRFTACGTLPSFIGETDARGFSIKPGIFQRSS